MIEYYTGNPQTMAELRVPLFEDKVVDFLAELIQVEDKKVDREILFLDPDEAEERMKSSEAKPETGEVREAKPEKKTKAKAKDKDEGQSEAKPRGAEINRKQRKSRKNSPRSVAGDEMAASEHYVNCLATRPEKIGTEWI